VCKKAKVGEDVCAKKWPDFFNLGVQNGPFFVDMLPVLFTLKRKETRVFAFFFVATTLLASSDTCLCFSLRCFVLLSRRVLSFLVCVVDFALSQIKIRPR
jgi:hypothetical protein